MEYTKDTLPDGTIYERYEGTPEEIISVLKYPIEHKEGKVRPIVKLGIQAYDKEGNIRSFTDIFKDLYLKI